MKSPICDTPAQVMVGLLWQNFFPKLRGIWKQTEGHSLGDYDVSGLNNIIAEHFRCGKRCIKAEW